MMLVRNYNDTSIDLFILFQLNPIRRRTPLFPSYWYSKPQSD